MTKTFGATLLLAALLSAGAVPAHAETTCTWQSGIVSDCIPCPQPVLTVTQMPPFTVGSPVVMHGSGFEPGETVTVADRNGSVALSAVAGAEGMFNLDWAVPDYNRASGVMLSAIGSVSNFETTAYQVRQDPAHITTGTDALSGWYPGEELLITTDGQPQPSQFASAEGTSSLFPEFTGKLEVRGKKSGGSYARLAIKTNNGFIRPPVSVEPAPVEAQPVFETPAVPVIEASAAVEPVLELQVEQVKAPAPSRPQPQAAAAASEPAGHQANAAAGIAAGALVAGAVTVLAVRRSGRKAL